MNELTYRPFSELNEDEAAQTQRLYEEAFPASLRVPFSDLVEGDTSADRFQRAVFALGDVVAFFVSSSLSEDWWFLEYIAVRSDMRGAGIGGQVLEQMVTDLGIDQSLVLEVEPPEDASDVIEREIRERRIRFYIRHRMRVLPVNSYVVPNVDGSGSERLLLMVKTTDPSRPDGAELQMLVRDLYTIGYGLHGNDQMLARALAGIE